MFFEKSTIVMVKSYECPVIFVRTFKFFGMFLSILVVGLVSTNITESYAADFSYTVECKDGTSEITIFDKNGTPMANASVMTMKKISSTNFEQQFKSDENGIVRIGEYENTGFIKISKSGYNDQKIMLEKCVSAPKSIELVQKDRIRIDAPVITDGYVSVPSNEIKITYAKIVGPSIGAQNGIIGIVKNISNHQLNKIILVATDTSRGISESGMPVMSSLRSGESSYFIIPFKTSPDCFEIKVDSFFRSPQYDVKILDDISLEFSKEFLDHMNEVSGDGPKVQYAAKSTYLGKNTSGIEFFLTVAYYKNEIIGYQLFSNIEGANMGDEMLISYLPLEPIFRTEKSKDVYFDGISVIEVIDKQNVVGTKNDKFYPVLEIHKSQNMIGEVFDSKDYAVGSCSDNSSNTPKKISKVPEWLKNNAEWWAVGLVDDRTFAQGVGYLIKEKIISITSTPQPTNPSEEGIPVWVKNNAKWWADGMISEDEFLRAIEYMVENGIVKVNEYFPNFKN